ncbi:PepSY-associated TM helix domain-containing protein [Aquisphaera insulae]|uniref:PepSY-associated TM helix domain-containing protein n=1 Tax=Aquisphaera insulae TaxID=2712864 RepID=UPI0013EB8DC0|nr:PepSY-associated TM helix domain-containing protein [Aquisphaera insulae]
MATTAGTDIDPAGALDRSGTGPTPASSSPARLTEGLYRVVWRWHFYAGLLVTPVLLIVTITGAAYIFRGEIEDAIHSRLRFVAPGGSRVGLSVLLDQAMSVRQGKIPAGLELSADSRRSVAFRFAGASPQDQAMVYLNPYNGDILGTVEKDTPGDVFQTILLIHRSLFLGTPGRILNELTSCWTILLMVTGFYLWWPRKSETVKGVWWPRWKGKLYVLLRDLHTVFGLYLLAPMFVIVFTGLFYTIVWSWGFHQVTRDRSRKPEPPSIGPTREASNAPVVVPRDFDRLVAVAHDRYPDRNLSFTFAAEGKPVSVMANNDWNNSHGEYVMARFQLDPETAEISGHRTLAQDEHYWWHGWVYPLHVGSLYGPLTKSIWMLACLVLCALPVTGLWMWWDRRPKGRAGFPRNPETPLPRGWIALITALAVLLPVAGASIVLILAGEWAYRAGRSRLARPAG